MSGPKHRAPDPEPAPTDLPDLVFPPEPAPDPMLVTAEGAC